MKEKPKPPNEEFPIENQNYKENMDKLKKFSRMIDENFSKVEEFMESNKTIFKVTQDTAHFKKKPDLDLQEKVEFLKNSRLIEDIPKPELENFSESLQNLIKVLENLEAFLSFKIKS